MTPTTPVERSRDAQPFVARPRALLAWFGGGLIGWALLIVGFVHDPAQTFNSYLSAYACALSLAIGMQIFVMSVNAMDATWPVAIRRVAEAATGTFPLLALLFIPLFFGLRFLYPWMRPESITDLHVRSLLLHKRAYFNWPFFIGRAIVYFLLFVGFDSLLRRWSFGMDRPGAPDRKGPAKVLSCVALPAVGLAATFAAFDWLMALSPDWYSTMYGLYYLSGGFIGSMALLVVLVVFVQRRGFLAEVGTSHFYGLGRTLFAFLIFWAYIAFFQFLLIWIGNKPLEARWYVERIHDGHRWVSQFLIWGHFAIPFLLLLSYWVKRRPGTLFVLSAWLLFAHYLDVHWLVAPALGRPGAFAWQDLAAIFAVGGFTVGFGLWRQSGHLIAPIHDPQFEPALRYESK
ncbi:MAG TPA: hypothetical protein VII38_05415 [Polyangia bacterium]